MILGTLLLTFLGAITAQVNAVVLKFTVDKVEKLTQLPNPMSEGIKILGIISAILLGKEIANIFISYGKNFTVKKYGSMSVLSLHSRLLIKF